MNERKCTSLIINKLPDGGYVIREWSMIEDHMPKVFLYACTHMDEALTYIRKQLDYKP